MASPKESIWGAPNTWIYSLRQYGLETTLAKTGHFDKPKTANFGEGSSEGYEGSLLRGIKVSQKLVANEFLDESICPCGQDPNVSPWGKIAIFNTNNDGSAVPKVQDFTDRNINWFFADKAASRPLFYRQVIKTSSNFMPYEQYAPKAATPITSSVVPTTLCPYVSWGLKSLLLSIEVAITLNNVNPISGSLIWVTLDDWKNNYSTTHYMTGLRFFVRGCTAINSTTLKLTYNNDGTLPAGEGCSGLICPMNKIAVKNGGETIPTQFLYFMGYEGTTRRAHIFTPTEAIYIDSSTAGVPHLGVFPCWNYFENQTIQVYRPYSDTYYYYYKIPYSDDTYNKIMSIAALFGCFFTPTNKYVFDYDMRDNDLYLPIIDDNGVGHGRYTRGAENANNPLYTKNSIRDIDYDPEAPPTPVDPNTYSNTTGFNSLSGGASATQRYVLNDSNVRQLLTDLWTISHTIAGADYEKYDYKILDSFLVTDPISSIVSLKRFPFDIPHTFSPSKTNVCLGKNQGTAQGYLTYNVFNSVSFSGVSIYPKFGRSFLDFAPYTEYELYIPFCSTVKLNASEILDHVLSVRMAIDLISGVCVAYIMADDLCIETVTGAVSSDMQIAGTDAATADAAIQNAVIDHISARTNKEVSMLSPMTPGGLMSVVMNPVKQAGSAESAENSLAKANYDITHINTPVHSMGSAGGLSSWIQEFNCRLIIYYPEGEAIDSSGGVSSTSPKLADLTDYAHNTGFACVMNGSVSEFHGLTVGNIDTSSIQGASEEERNMIKTLFSQGVWLP